MPKKQVDIKTLITQAKIDAEKKFGAWVKYNKNEANLKIIDAAKKAIKELEESRKSDMNQVEERYFMGELKDKEWEMGRVKVMKTLNENEIDEFNQLNKILLESGLFIKPCAGCVNNSEYKSLKAKAEFILWEYRDTSYPRNGKYTWDMRDYPESIFLKNDGQWVWGSDSVDGVKGKVPRGMKCKRRGMLSRGSNCAKGYTCDREKLICVKKGTENKRKFIPKMFSRKKNAGRSRKKKRRKSTKKRRRKRRKSTKKKRRRRRR